MTNDKIINDLKNNMNKMENKYYNSQIDIEKYKKQLDQKNKNYKNLVNKIELLEIKEKEFKALKSLKMKIKRKIKLLKI